jgi:hypothetical protein
MKSAAYRRVAPFIPADCFADARNDDSTFTMSHFLIPSCPIALSHVAKPKSRLLEYRPGANRSTGRLTWLNNTPLLLLLDD